MPRYFLDSDHARSTPVDPAKQDAKAAMVMVTDNGREIPYSPATTVTNSPDSVKAAFAAARAREDSDRAARDSMRASRAARVTKRA